MTYSPFFDLGYDCVGGDLVDTECEQGSSCLSGAKPRTLPECEAWCTTSPGCKGFTYSSDGQQCVLKSIDSCTDVRYSGDAGDNPHNPESHTFYTASRETVPLQPSPSAEMPFAQRVIFPGFLLLVLAAIAVATPAAMRSCNSRRPRATGAIANPVSTHTPRVVVSLGGKGSSVSGTRITSIRKTFSMRRYTGLDERGDERSHQNGRARIGHRGEMQNPATAELSEVNHIEEDQAGL